MGEKNFEIKHFKLPNDVNLNDFVDFEYFDKAVRENATHAYDAMRYAVEDIGITRTKYNQCYAEKKDEIINSNMSEKEKNEAVYELNLKLWAKPNWSEVEPEGIEPGE